MQNSERAPLSCAIELAVTVLLWHFVLWFVMPRAADASPIWIAIWLVLVAPAALWMVWISPRFIHHFPRTLRGVGPWKSFFVRTEELGRSIRTYSIITVLGCIVLLSNRLARPGAILPLLTWKSVTLRFASYVIGALVQVLFYFEFCQPRLRTIFGDRAAIWGSALIFSLFHFPNAPVMGMGLAVSYFWAREYLFRPNLILLTLSHAILGSSLVLIAGIIPRMGPFYLHPEKYFFRSLMPWWKHLVNGLW
jgi:hypothetical protein